MWREPALAAMRKMLRSASTTSTSLPCPVISGPTSWTPAPAKLSPPRYAPTASASIGQHSGARPEHRKLRYRGADLCRRSLSPHHGVGGEFGPAASWCAGPRLGAAAAERRRHRKLARRQCRCIARRCPETRPENLSRIAPANVDPEPRAKINRFAPRLRTPLDNCDPTIPARLSWAICFSMTGRIAACRIHRTRICFLRYAISATAFSGTTYFVQRLPDGLARAWRNNEQHILAAMLLGSVTLFKVLLPNHLTAIDAELRARVPAIFNSVGWMMRYSVLIQ